MTTQLKKKVGNDLTSIIMEYANPWKDIYEIVIGELRAMHIEFDHYQEETYDWEDDSHNYDHYGDYKDLPFHIAREQWVSYLFKRCVAGWSIRNKSMGISSDCYVPSQMNMRGKKTIRTTIFKGKLLVFVAFS